jgi:hypothetical protein
MSKEIINEEGIIREGEIFDELQDDVSTDKSSSSEEVTNTEDTQSLKGDNKDETLENESVPFHKHPRFQQLVEEKNKALEKIAELESYIKPNKDNVLEEIPEEFVELFGDDRDIWDKWKKLNSRQKEEMEREIIEKIRTQEQEEIKKKENLQKYVENSIKSLQDKGEVFDQNELIKFMIEFEDKYAPILNKDGNYDFEKGLELMKQLKPQQKKEDTTPKKEVAKILSEKTKPSTNDSAALSIRTLRNKSFTTLAEED